MESEIDKYVQRRDFVKLCAINEGVKEMDAKINAVRDGGDFARIFGRQSADLMFYHIATNGSLRSKFNHVRSIFGNLNHTKRFRDIL